ncbi:short transient receptor potential channel 4-associated protein [Parasteatoda tepidariorum]|uniref:short transient receptor potential channel 4-associated protein n=1 Tax=Parasteatoda tepidariorum TaxID=114398 RepID=UPI001C724B49|nr:short transient receptor potential channel 4-associated protein-like [Parasteatoda tepidariorum]
MMNFSRRSKKLRSSNTIVNTLCNNALYGELSRSLYQVSQLCLKNYENYNNCNLSELCCIVKKLDDTLVCWSSTKADVLQVFWDLNQELQELEKKDVADNEDTCTNKEEILYFKHFILEHAVKILWRFILAFSLFPMKTQGIFVEKESLQLKSIALEVLHNILSTTEGLAEQSAEDKNVLNCIFSYLQFKETCFPACKVIECLILARKSALDLSSIKNLKEIVLGFEDVQLGNFCKILAITLSELDMYENKTSLHAQTKEKKNQNFFVRDVNQDVVLKIPNILSRLVNIACAKPCVPWFSGALPLESDQWLHWIDEQLSNDRQIDKDDYTNSWIGGISQWSEYSCSGPLKTSIRISLELTFRADAVCVLGLLLVGRHRKDVQKELADLKLVPQLSNLFDHFIWKINQRDYTRLPGHNNACECSPEVALKIQVLRLIHSFCDHSDYKHVMLSWNEYSELQSLRDALDISNNSPWLKRDVMCVGTKGLLSKIVEVIKKETGASTFRFWLSRAIESFLRGSFCNADQDFLLRRNLLEDVVQNLLLNTTVRHKEVLQSSFDLLGELVKFNFSAFHVLHTQIINTPRIQKKLMNLMNGHLVDSNMFIRSLILSYEIFISSDDEDLKAYAEKFNPLLSHVGLQRSRIQYLQRLLSLINIHNLTQENVSCLNTVLVILMFGLKKGEIPQYLQCLASNQEDCSVATNLAGLLDNLKNLLLFWQDHYLQKDKDCTILEKSSRICFQEWKAAVSLLTSDDLKNPYTIAFYTVPAVSSRAL